MDIKKRTCVWVQGREFTLVFRTFGADVTEVVEEMNAFATGKHPCYPEVRPDATCCMAVVAGGTLRCRHRLDNLARPLLPPRLVLSYAVQLFEPFYMFRLAF